MMWSQFVTTSKLEDNKYSILVKIFDPKGKKIQNIDFEKIEVGNLRLQFATSSLEQKNNWSQIATSKIFYNSIFG